MRRDSDEETQANSTLSQSADALIEAARLSAA